MNENGVFNAVVTLCEEVDSEAIILRFDTRERVYLVAMNPVEYCVTDAIPGTVGARSEEYLTLEEALARFEEISAKGWSRTPPTE